MSNSLKIKKNPNNNKNPKAMKNARKRKIKEKIIINQNSEECVSTGSSAQDCFLFQFLLALQQNLFHLPLFIWE